MQEQVLGSAGKSSPVQSKEIEQKNRIALLNVQSATVTAQWKVTKQDMTQQ